MPVIRTTKTSNYTVVDNRFLKNTDLSLRSKGLFTQLLSLPDTWVYSISGLASLSRDGEDSIRSGIRELEQAGYITRRPRRDKEGKFCGYEYLIREVPVSAAPSPGQPSPEAPATVCPSSEEQTLSNKDPSNTEISSNNLSIIQSDLEKPAEANRMEKTYTAIREQVMANISYEELLRENPFRQPEVAELLEVIVETLCAECQVIRAGRKDYPADLVKQRLRSLNIDHLRYVMECMTGNTTQIRNMKQYMLTALFNAPVTIDTHYTAMVNHDQAHSA